MESKQLQTKDFLTRSIGHLDRTLNLFSNNGNVVTSKDVITMDMIVSENVMCTKILIKQDELPRLSALYVLALKELWRNSENTFTNDSITSCALLMINTYPEWLPNEVILMLRNGMACKYGKPYGKINTIEVMRWAKEYDETDRVAYFEKKATEKPNSDWKDIHKDIIKEFPKMTPKEKPKPFVPREKTEQEKIIHGCMGEFNELYKIQNPDGNHGMRFVMVGGKQLSEMEFVEFKLKSISPLQAISGE